MYDLFIVITVLISLALMGIVLMQSSKGNGLAGTFGGAANIGTMFGSRRTADFLSKATWWLGGALFVLSILINLFLLQGKTGLTKSDSIIQSSHQLPASPSVPSAPAKTK